MAFGRTFETKANSARACFQIWGHRVYVRQFHHYIAVLYVQAPVEVAIGFMAEKIKRRHGRLRRLVTGFGHLKQHCRLENLRQESLALRVCVLQLRSGARSNRRGHLKGEDDLGNRVLFTKRRKRQCLALPQIADIQAQV